MPKALTLAFPFAAVLLAFASVPRAGDAPDAADLAAAKTITAADLKKDLEYLASDELEGRATGSIGQQKAADYLVKRFAELKLEPGGDNKTYKQKINYKPRKRNKSESAPATDAAPIEVCNVVGILRGSDPALGAIVFSAHYDHLGRGRANKEGDDIYNGADDDGSGTVSVLALAKAYSSRGAKPKRTLVFACFTGEETGGAGSQGYVKNPPVPLEKTICNINLEMLGRTHGIGEKRAWLTGWSITTLGPILAKGAKAADIEIYEDPYPEQKYYLRSDNVSFVNEGVIGQTVSAGSNHPQYHTPDDEVGLIEFNNMELLIRGVYLGSSMIASGAEEPKKTGDSLMPTNAPPRKKPSSAPAK